MEIEETLVELSFVSRQLNSFRLLLTDHISCTATVAGALTCQWGLGWSYLSSTTVAVQVPPFCTSAQLVQVSVGL